MLSAYYENDNNDGSQGDIGDPIDITGLINNLFGGVGNLFKKTHGEGGTAYSHTSRPELPDSMNQRSDNDCVKASYLDPKNLKNTHPWCFDKKTGAFKNFGMKPDFNYAKNNVDKLGTFQTDAHGDRDYVQAAQDFAKQNGYLFNFNGGKITFTKPQKIGGFAEWMSNEKNK